MQTANNQFNTGSESRSHIVRVMTDAYEVNISFPEQPYNSIEWHHIDHASYAMASSDMAYFHSKNTTILLHTSNKKH